MLQDNYASPTGNIIYPEVYLPSELHELLSYTFIQPTKPVGPKSLRKPQKPRKELPAFLFLLLTIVSIVLLVLAWMSDFWLLYKIELSIAFPLLAFQGLFEFIRIAAIPSREEKFKQERAIYVKELAEWNEKKLQYNKELEQYKKKKEAYEQEMLFFTNKEYQQTKKKEIINQYTSNLVQKLGKTPFQQTESNSEKDPIIQAFAEKLQGEGFKIVSNAQISTQNSIETPDFIAISAENYHYAIFIDASFSENQPIHYLIKSDDKKAISIDDAQNQALVNKGWIVVRFNQWQIIDQEAKCVDYLKSVNTSFTEIDNQLITVPSSLRLRKRTKEQALEWLAKNK